MDVKESACGTAQGISPNGLSRDYDGFGCTKEDALNAAWDKLIAALDDARTQSCSGGTCPEGEECALIVDEDEGDVVDTPTYRRVRLRGCSKRVGYRCRLSVKQLNAIETNCVCVPAGV